MNDQKLQRSQKKKNANPDEKQGVETISKRAQKKLEREKDNKEPKKTFWVQIRLLPIWLRLILIFLLIAIVAVIGLRIGYSYVGDGNPEDVLKKETWTHILDIIKGNE